MPWRTRAALLDRTETAAKQAVKDRGLTINLYRVPGGYEAREASIGAPSCSNELLKTLRPAPPAGPGPAATTAPSPARVTSPDPAIPTTGTGPELAGEVARPAAEVPPAAALPADAPPPAPTAGPAPEVPEQEAARPAVAADRPPGKPPTGPKRVK